MAKVYQDDPKQFESPHEIETYLLGKVRAIGNNVLGGWAESLEKEVSTIERAKQGVRKHSKKTQLHDFTRRNLPLRNGPSTRQYSSASIGRGLEGDRSRLLNKLTGNHCRFGR